MRVRVPAVLATATAATVFLVPSFAYDSGAASDSGANSPVQAAAAPVVDRTIVKNRTTPWGLDFLPNGDAVVTSRDNRRVLRVTPGGNVREIRKITWARPNNEGGVLGIAVSPRFRTDRAVFVYFTAATQNIIKRYVMRSDGTLRSDRVIKDGIPAAGIHNGGRLEFGPDGMLYAGTGDAANTSRSQNPRSLGGKILRMTRSGRAPADNPNPRSVVYSLGHRNVQGLAFDAQGRLWASELGQNTWDELNLIRAGRNYGWPIEEGRDNNPNFVGPKEVWPTSDASPSGLAHHDGALYMAALRGQRLWRIPTQGTATGDPEHFFFRRFGRIRAVEPAPDGSLWMMNHNTDGRGDPAPTDDRIFRLRTP